MTGNELAAWLETRGMSKSEFQRKGGPTQNTTRSLIDLGDRQLPTWVERTCLWIALPDDIRTALCNTYEIPTNK